MESAKLYVVYLGGKLTEGRMGEDHEGGGSRRA